MKPTLKAFAGGNSPLGFYSFFDQIIDQEQGYVYAIKGGPGTGKSTFISNVAQRIYAAGHIAERFYCSADPDSLDAIYVPGLDTALIDATSPHPVELKYPGSGGVILDFGRFWHRGCLQRKHKQIIELQQGYKHCYGQAYSYIRAAQALYRGLQAANSGASDPGLGTTLAAEVAGEIYGKGTNRAERGRVRKLFASAITAKGCINHLENLAKDYPFQYIVKGHPGSGRTGVLEFILKKGIAGGEEIQAFYCPLDPENKLEHLLLPQRGAAVITSEWPHCYSSPKAVVIDLGGYGENAPVHSRTSSPTYRELLRQSTDWLQEGKQIHDQLEAVFSDAMDFDSVDRLLEQVVQEMLAHHASP